MVPPPAKEGGDDALEAPATIPGCRSGPEGAGVGVRPDLEDMDVRPALGLGGDEAPSTLAACLAVKTSPHLVHCTGAPPGGMSLSSST